MIQKGSIGKRTTNHPSDEPLALGFLSARQAERGLTLTLGDGTTTNALRADPNGLVRSVLGRDMNTLEVGTELAPRDSGDLGTHATEVFSLTSM